MEPDLFCEGTGFSDGGEGLREECSEGDCVAPPGLVTAHPVKLDVEVLEAKIAAQREAVQRLSDRAAFLRANCWGWASRGKVQRLGQNLMVGQEPKVKKKGGSRRAKTAAKGTAAQRATFRPRNR